MTARPSVVILSLLGFLTILLCVAMAHAFLAPASSQQGRSLVSQLGLSDLSLLTEARYTRHPSMADLHSPFQDHPVSIDHFPAGSLIGPPKHLQSTGGQMIVKSEPLP
nr:hypothetical protein [uncultured Cohaesibacter sp.]